MNIATLGNCCLALAVLGSGGAVLASICASRFKSQAALRNARWLIHLVTALLTIALGALVYAILNNEFALEYVAGHSNKALPLAYKLSAIWAGGEGSLLLWAWMIAGASSIAVILLRKDEPASYGPAIGILGAICGMFIALMLFTSNPFALGKVVPADGFDMNPLLQHLAMIAHPPTLFLGYAGFAVPFALAFGALIGGRSDNRWIAPIRRWVIASWLFLTIGIVLGAWWAYVELGWGGYWAWDAVENASLLPWFTGTALMHSLIVQQRRGTLKVWNIWLISLTFLLCIFGTYLTRSGVIQSVHTFQPSSVGPFILEMLRVGVAFSVGVIIWRRCLLKSERKVEKLFSYEGAFIAGSVLLTIIMLTTLVGTIFPVLSKPFAEDPVTLGKEFFNKAVVPMILLLAALMAAGPLIRYANAPGAVMRRLIAPGIVTAVAVIGAGFWSASHKNFEFLSAWSVGHIDFKFLSAGTIWMMVCAAIAAFTVACIVEDVIRTAGPLRWATIRRWGGQLVHLGMVMMVIGVAGSSIYKTEKTMALKAGDVKQIGKYNVRLEGQGCVDGDNYHAEEVRIGVSAPGIEEFILRPQRRKYHSRPKKHFSEVDFDTGPLEDVYVTFAGSTEDGEIVHVEVVINPLVLWIWIGGIAMSLGSLVCLVSPGARRSKTTAPPDIPPAVCPEVPQ